MSTPARYNHQQQLDTICVEFSFATQGLAAGICIGAVPVGSRIVHSHVVIDTAFNSGTSDDMTVGLTPGAAEIATAANIAARAAGYKTFDTPKTLLFTKDTQLFMKWAPVGAAATAGKGFLYLGFVTASDVGGFYPPQ